MTRDDTISPSPIAHVRAPVSPLEATLLFTAFVAICYGFGIYLFANLAAEMRVDLALDYGEIGFATGIAQLGFLASSLLSGIWAIRIGPVRVMQASVAATALSLLAMSRLPEGGLARGDALWMLTALLTIQAAGAASVWVPMVALSQSIIPARHRAKALGLMSSGTAYGVFANGLIIPPLVMFAGWRGVWVAAGLGATALLAVGVLRLRRLPSIAQPPAESSTRPARAARAARPARPAGWQELARPLSLVLAVTMFCNGLACMPFQTYLVPLLQEELGESLAFASLVWSAIGAIGMASGFLLGLVADRISIKWAMVLTYVFLTAAAALMLILILAGNLPVALPAIIAGILFALAFYAIFGLVPAYISLVYSAASATLLFGLGNIALGLGGFIGNMAGGWLREATGSFAAIYGIVAMAAIAQIILAVLLPNERKRAIG